MPARAAPMVAACCCAAIQVVAFIGLVLSVAFTPSYVVFGWLSGEGWIAAGAMVLTLIPVIWFAAGCIRRRGTARVAGIALASALVTEVVVAGLYLPLWRP